jgi:nucleoid-associated protein YgaU
LPLALAAVALCAGVAQAQLSEGVVAAFRGKIVLTRAAVATGANDKDTIAKLRAAQLAEIAGASTDDGQVWRFHYAAFLKKAGNVALKMRYISGEQDRRTVTETAIPIPDVDSAVLAGDLSISERQGLERGKAYVLQLVNDKGDIVAKTSVILK